MNSNNNKKTGLLSTVIAFLFTVYSSVSLANSNVVPNPISIPTGGLSLGLIINRVVGFIPVAVTFMIVIVVIRASIQIAMAGEDAEKKQGGFKRIMNAGIAAAVLYSLWLIFAVIEITTGAKLFSWGQ